MYTTPLSPPSRPATPTPFDKRSFLKYVKDIGRPYRKRAVELVSICRTFVQAQDQTDNSYYDLRSALQLVDDALMSAKEAGKKTSKEADDAIENAVIELGNYERRYHFNETVAERIKMAEKADKSSLKALNCLVENIRPLKEGQTIPVEFLLHKSLPDKNPTVVTQALCTESHLNEILWNFSRHKDKEKRLTLKQNPHFYKVLPTLPENYGDKFLTEPIETYLHKRISVLTDNLGQAGRVFLRLVKKTRAFGNAWIPKNAIIFKDVCGKLEGESRVGKVIKETPNLWCFRELPPSRTSPSSPSSIRSSPSLTTTATPTTCSKGLLLTDWREPIREMLRSPDVNIRISTKPPINYFPSSPVPSSPQSGFNSSVGSLPSISELPPAESSSRPPARPSPEPPVKLSSQPAAVPAPSTSVPLPTPLPPQPPSVAPPSTSSATPARKTRPLPDTHPSGVSREDGTLPIPLPPQPSSAASPSASSATPARITQPPPDTHPRRVSREGGTSLGDRIPSQPLIAEVPSSGLSVTPPPIQVMSTVMPHASGHEVKLAGHVPSRHPGPSYLHEVARVVTPDPLPQQHVATGVPTLQVPEPPSQAQKRKKNWFQRHVYDYGK